MGHLLLDDNLIEKLLVQAAENPRLRVGFDLRTTPDDQSQRMLNTLMPGTSIPIHRHRESDETMIVVRGSIIEVYYDDNGNEVSSFTLASGSNAFGIQIPRGQWHSVKVTEPCTILEIKDGAYFPQSKEDLLNPKI